MLRSCLLRGGGAMKSHMPDKHVTVLDCSVAEFHVKFTHVKHVPNVRSVCTLVEIPLLSAHNLVAVCTIREFVLIYFLYSLFGLTGVCIAEQGACRGCCGR
jgi:hypothetical protein